MLQAKYDDDGSGEIDAEELMGILKSLGLDVTEKEVHAMVHEVDEDGSGTIDFQEFKAMVKKVSPACRSACRCVVSDPFCVRRRRRTTPMGLGRKAVSWR